jgi:hypothetical protein
MVPPNYSMHPAKNAGRNQLISSVHRQYGLWFGVDWHHALRATSGMPNHALNFDGNILQIKGTGFTSRAPLFALS